jgi:tRNA A-37 threonylcarbamoyl transferase component Bud32
MEYGRLLARGRMADVFELGPGSVLKLYQPSCPGEWIATEARITGRLADLGLPVPRCQGEMVVEGRRGLVLQRIVGTPLVEEMLSRPWTILRYARLFAEAQLGIHRVDGGGLPSLRASLQGRIEADGSMPPALRRGALSVLEGLPEGHGLCHGDYHTEQVLVGEQGLVVLDWMTAARGSPAADVARTSVLSLFGGASGLSPWQKLVVAAARGTFYRAYRSHYHLNSPTVTAEDVRRWMVPVAAARLCERIPGEATRLLAFLQAQLGARGDGPAP